LGGVLGYPEESSVFPIELTYENLIKVVQVTQENIENGVWTTVAGMQYLKENAIIDILSTEIVENKANNWCCILCEAYENDNVTEWDALQEGLEKIQKNTWKPPSLVYGIKIFPYNFISILRCIYCFLGWQRLCSCM
jgi:hypothetical protein